MHMISDRLTDDEFEMLREFRHDLHRHPELSHKEIRTTEKIRAFLSALPGVELLDLPIQTGVVARISRCTNAGDLPVSKVVAGQPGPAVHPGLEIMLRADIDALPQTEQTPVDWRSEVPGVMHACGHDVHTASLCGAALLLSKAWQRGDLKNTVDLVFQPAEEGTTGARMLIDAGLFERIHPSACFGMHNWPSVDAGKVVCHEGALMSAKRNFDIILYGAGGHGSMPHLNIDPIVCAAAVVQSLQTVISRNTNPLDAAILSINMIEGGSPMNLVVDRVLMKATVRSLSEKALDRALERVETIVEKTAQAYECRSEIIWKERIPAVWNSKEMTQTALAIAQEAGCELTQAPPSLASEDFALYRQYAPSFFFWIGSRTPGAETYELHTPLFHADDSTIRQAAQLYAACGTGQGTDLVSHFQTVEPKDRKWDRGRLKCPTSR